jgi:SAM-dependent methyltransferase
MSDHPTLTEQVTANRASWNERVAIHLADRSGIYEVDAFLDGADALMPIEAAELGDISGLRVAHLQCHFGLDTLSLARRGVASIVGLDFSNTALEAARDLSSRAGLEARFVCADVYDAPQVLGRAAFDLVYVTWGALNWLPDIGAWSRVVATLLAPGGRVYLADCHPVMARLEWVEDRLTFHYPADTSNGLRFDEPATYAGDGTTLRNATTYEWVHSLGRIVSSLASEGLRLDFLHEHDTLPWPAVEIMEPAPGRMFRLPDGVLGPPVSFSLRASKPR